MKRCPTEGCNNTIGPGQEMCAGCAVKEARQEAAFALYINDGIRHLGEYLGWWALFEARYGPN